MSTAHAAIKLPATLARQVDRLSRDRSKFVVDAVRRELRRQQHDGIQRSLRNPHPDSRNLAKLGLKEWQASLPEDDPADLVDVAAGSAVRWTPNKGWIELDNAAPGSY